MDYEFSFENAFFKLHPNQRPAVRDGIMLQLGITSRQAWYKRLRGQVVPKGTEMRIIEGIFAEYGIENIWGVKTSKESQ